MHLGFKSLDHIMLFVQQSRVQKVALKKARPKPTNNGVLTPTHNMSAFDIGSNLQSTNVKIGKKKSGKEQKNSKKKGEKI